MIRRLSFIVCLFMSIVVYGQRSEIPNVSLGKKNFNIGLIGVADTIRGVQINLLQSHADYMSGFQFTPVIGSAGHMNGYQFAWISTLAKDMTGLQMAAINNSTLGAMEGMQLSAFTNVAVSVNKGLQLASTNITSTHMNGVQIGGYNYSDTLNGAQVGFINMAQQNPKGWQIGILNYSRDTLKHSVGLVNINPETEIDFMAFGGNTSLLNTAVRIRNGNAFKIVGFGTFYQGLNKKFSGAVFYRAGRYFLNNKRWRLGADLGYYHVETLDDDVDLPSRHLYSLQAHINVDYLLSKRWSIFASAGYEDTHFYKKNELQRRGLVAQLGIAYNYERHHRVRKKYMPDPDFSDANAFLKPKRKSWLAALEVTLINVGVHCFDRFVTNERFAQTTMSSIKRNFETGFVWDNDYFSTNLIAHPYHGNLYFNAARSLGHNFWQSVPFALGGSLMWEFFGEKDPPAINDVFATTMGGVCIGEILYRLSDMFLDDRSKGAKRFWREAASTVLSPMKGINRIASGKAWKVKKERGPYLRPDGLGFRVEVGDRYLADNGEMFRGEHQASLSLEMEYGDVLDDDNNKPYDFFDLAVTFGFGGSQPFVHNVHLLGRLWSATVVKTTQLDSEFGFYQHFNYYNSNPVSGGSDQTPYKVSEAASLGPGFVFRYNNIGSLWRFEQRTFLSLVLLGGSKSDYYNVLDRDYNMGSGYSMKTQTIINFRTLCSLRLSYEYYRLFTWKGYEDIDLSTVDPFYLNAQGDKGNARLTILKGQFNFPITKNLDIELSGNYFIRKTHYAYYDDVRAKTFELRVGLGYEF